MSKVTDRVDNQNLINLARQQYETEKRSKLPSVIVNLPSGGNVYPKDHPLRGGTIEMRYMTAYDEDILTNSSYIRNGVLFEKLLESIILTPVAVKEISGVDQFALIINARILAYGPEYPVSIIDPKTKQELKRTVNLSKLKAKPFNLVCDEFGEFDYQVSNSCSIKFRFPYEDKEYDSISEYLNNIIMQVNQSRSKSDIENFIRYEFMAYDAKQFRKYVGDNTPGLDYNVEFEGEDGSTFHATFPIGSDLFWF